MNTYYLAVDIGASSGRHILGQIVNGTLEIEEVYRFKNNFKKDGKHLYWDVESLFTEILNGLKACKEIGKIPSFMGIDTWGVDYVLLDEQDSILGKAYGYRDSRTHGMDSKVNEFLSIEDLYSRTGIQKMIFNTVYQLMAVKEQSPKDMEKATSMLMMPDYFHFLLTGVKKMEYTNATTGQLVNAKTCEWDEELIEMLGYKRDLFVPLSMPGEVVGFFAPKVQEEVGFNCQVLLPPTHDTACAVVAVPSNEENVIYLSSGTWSLMGVEREEADCSPSSQKANFTNEGGYNHRFRYLKNIMGLWMIQSVKREFEEDMSFDKLCEDAAKETITSIVDCNSEEFLAPESMIQAVKDHCANTNQEVPETSGAIAAVIYNSLAKCYGDVVQEIEAITGQTYNAIHIVGGGSKDTYLNELTAKYTKKDVFAGPNEATALGNIATQMLSTGAIHNLDEARDIIRTSFKIKKYTK